MSPLNPEPRMLIDGELVEAAGGKRYPNISPATEECLGETADASAEDMDRAIAAARAAFDESGWATDHELRKRCLCQLHEALVAAQDEIRPTLAAEAGAPMGIARGPICDSAISFIPAAIQVLGNFQWSRDLGESEVFGWRSRLAVYKEPVGVVACITPWNVPMQINLAKSIPALAAGCSVVLKPAVETPWAATHLGRIVKEQTDIPAGIFNVVTSSHPVTLGEQLVGDDRVDMVSFTGSTATGRRVMGQAAEMVKKVFLELGGKSAHIVLDDADMGTALLPTLSVCFHAGQGCALPTRLLIPASRREEAEELLKQYYGGIEYGDPEAANQIMGPVVSERQRDRVLGYIEKGKQEGATLLMGGKRPERLPKGYYIEPTIFTDVTNDMTIAREEIFGPVLSVITFEDDDDAVRIANDSIYGLSGGVSSASEERALSVAKRIRTGTININGGNFYSGDAPFGGYKQSGIGREMGLEGFEEHLETKTVAIGV